MSRTRRRASIRRRGASDAGFTLVEAAIVLVIIGLILAVVLQGRALVANAEYRSLKAAIDDYQSAYYAFRDRYNARPGDFDRASDRLTDDFKIKNGNGNGIIEDGEDGPECGSGGNADEENCLAWQHLRAAGLIEGDPEDEGGAARPRHDYNGFFDALFTGDAGNGRFADKLLVTGVPGHIAQRLDDDVDDGAADRGRVACHDEGDCGEYPGRDETADFIVEF